MHYMLNNDVYFRSYGEVGYITSTGLFQDKVVDAAGAVFLAQLTRTPQSMDDLASRIASCFTGADESLVKEDAMEFYRPFVEDGFLASGSTAEEAWRNAQGFTYDIAEPHTMKHDFTPDRLRSQVDSQNFLDDFFLRNPKLMNFQMELTSRCNERCVHCYIPHELKEGDIAPELFYRALDQLQELGTWHLTLSGGEPMLHPYFKEFLAAAKNRDFYVSILSNLTMLDDETIDLMKAGNVSSVQVSLYSMDPERHDAITQLPGSFVKTKEAIEKLIANNIPVQVSCPTMKGNKNDFGDVLRWANGHKIRAITDYMIMAEYNHDTSNLAHRLSPEECGEVIEDIIAWDTDYQEQLLSPHFEDQAREYADDPDAALCGVGISTCCMVSNGNVYPCPGWQSYVCGNLQHSSLKDIWEKSDEMRVLRSIRRSALKPCLECDKRAFCSPCMVRNANESPAGDPFEINPHFCAVAQVNKNIAQRWREKQGAATSD